jgi:hypothetical protein
MSEKAHGEPSLRQRLSGDVVTRERASELREAAIRQTRIETIKKTFFSTERQPLAEVATYVYEDACNSAGTRDFDTIVDNPEFGQGVIVANSVVNSIEGLGGKLTGWTREHGFEKAIHEPGKYVSLYKDFRYGERGIIDSPGLIVDGEVVVRPRIRPLPKK